MEKEDVACEIGVIGRPGDVEVIKHDYQAADGPDQDYIVASTAIALSGARARGPVIETVGFGAVLGSSRLLSTHVTDVPQQRLDALSL